MQPNEVGTEKRAIDGHLVADPTVQPDALLVDIGVAVVQHQQQFLVGLRDGRSDLAGKAEFPGGKVELGESPAAAAIRECREETGLLVEITHSHRQHVEHYEHTSVRLHFFAARLANAYEQPTAPWRWVSREELQQLDFPTGNRFLIHDLTTGSR